MWVTDDQGWPLTSADLRHDFGVTEEDLWVKTPGFDRVAEQGIHFHRAYSSGVACTAARAGILTGRYHWLMQEAAIHLSSLPDRYRTIFDVLDDAGYHAARTGKGWGPGYTYRETVPTVFWTNRFQYGKQFPEAPPGIYFSHYFENFRWFLDQREPGQPFIYWIGPFEPHGGWGNELHPEYDERLPKVDLPFLFPDFSGRRKAMQLAFEIEWQDQHLQWTLDHLEAIGELENTIIIVTSDQGTPHSHAKGYTTESGLHVPLAIMWKGTISPNRHTDEIVELIDLAPTIFEAAGVDPPPTLTGKSIFPYLLDETETAVFEDNDYALGGLERINVFDGERERFGMRALFKGDFVLRRCFTPGASPSDSAPPLESYSPDHFIEGFNMTLREYWQMAFGPRPEFLLHNVKDDPLNAINLANDPAHADKLEEMKQLMENRLGELGDPAVLGFGEIFKGYFQRGDPLKERPDDEFLDQVAEKLSSDTDGDGFTLAEEVAFRIQEARGERLPLFGVESSGEDDAFLRFNWQQSSIDMVLEFSPILGDWSAFSGEMMLTPEGGRIIDAPEGFYRWQLAPVVRNFDHRDGVPLEYWER